MKSKSPQGENIAGFFVSVPFRDVPPEFSEMGTRLGMHYPMVH